MAKPEHYKLIPKSSMTDIKLQGVTRSIKYGIKVSVSLGFRDFFLLVNRESELLEDLGNR